MPTLVMSATFFFQIMYMCIYVVRDYDHSQGSRLFLVEPMDEENAAVSHHKVNADGDALNPWNLNIIMMENKVIR